MVGKRVARERRADAGSDASESATKGRGAAGEGRSASPTRGSTGRRSTSAGAETKGVGAPSPASPPPSAAISLRLPGPMLEALRRHAARRSVPYQSLLKHWLAERLEEEAAREARLAGG